MFGLIPFMVKVIWMSPHRIAAADLLLLTVNQIEICFFGDLLMLSCHGLCAMFFGFFKLFKDVISQSIGYGYEYQQNDDVSSYG